MSESYDKRCSRCAVTKPIDDFNRQVSSKDGRKAWCRECCRVYKADWDRSHAEHVTAYGQQYREKNLDMVREKSLRRYHAVYKHDPEYRRQSRERCARWAKDHPTANKEYIVAHRKHLNERAKARRDSDPSKHRRWVKESFKRRKTVDPERFRLAARERASRRRAAIRDQSSGQVDYRTILERHGRVCHLCGGTIGDDLHFDHVIPIAKGGAHAMDNIRPAHASCNFRKSSRLIESQRF